MAIFIFPGAASQVTPDADGDWDFSFKEGVYGVKVIQPFNAVQNLPLRRVVRLCNIEKPISINIYRLVVGAIGKLGYRSVKILEW